MSELMYVRTNRADLRWRLLATASAGALVIAAVSAANAGEDVDRPTVWIELGGQLDNVSREQNVYSPPSMANVTQPNLLSALNVQQPTSAFGIEGKISVQPESSDWVFSAGIRYGRSKATRHQHQQTANKTVPISFNITLPPPYGAHHVGPKYYYPTQHVKFADGKDTQHETHLVIDFQAGKDLGIGLFGSPASFVLSAGVRIAQFSSQSNVNLRVEPDVQYPTAPVTSKYQNSAFLNAHPRFHDYAGLLESQRSFRGIGPSLAWNSSIPFLGRAESGELSLDLGLNGAVLFGRQKTRGSHTTAVHSYYMSDGWRRGFQQGKLTPGHFSNRIFYTCHGEQLTAPGAPNECQTDSTSISRSRMVTVPNLGGFAGFTYRVEDFKVSLGYRADFFFGAMDTGIDTRQTKDIGFYGPFASVSIGLGG
jgi:hypothetical protein